MSTPTIHSVVKAFEILSTFGADCERLTTTDISQELGMNYKTAHRFLMTLEHLGAVTRFGRSDFTLGVLMNDLGDKVSINRILQKHSIMQLETLVDTYGEYAHVAVFHNGEAMTIVHMRGKHAHPIENCVGQCYPLHCSAVGKVIVAGKDYDMINAVVKLLHFEQKTVNTIISRNEFLRHIKIVKKQGFAIEDQETRLKYRAIAVPIYSHIRKVVGALSISGPVSRITTTILQEAKSDLMECASRISTSIYGNQKEDISINEKMSSSL